MQSTFKIENELRSIRRWLVFFMVALFFSGLTAIPAEQELALLTGYFSTDTAIGSWLHKVYNALAKTNQEAPSWLMVTTGWPLLISLAILFIGPLRDPVRNKWVLGFGMIACWLIVPFALIAGHYRGIPLGWRFIDCLFGVIGLFPLIICYKKINKLEIAAEKIKQTTYR